MNGGTTVNLNRSIRLCIACGASHVVAQWIGAAASLADPRSHITIQPGKHVGLLAVHFHPCYAWTVPDDIIKGETDKAVLDS